jgi:hypothetical protein
MKHIHNHPHVHPAARLQNIERAERAEYAVQQAAYADDPECVVRDVLCDLMHYCRLVGPRILDFDEELRIARDHFDAEVREEN